MNNKKKYVNLAFMSGDQTWKQRILKTSKVIPLYKAKDQTFLSNYRPLALLPSISKLFEYVLL